MSAIPICPDPPLEENGKIILDGYIEHMRAMHYKAKADALIYYLDTTRHLYDEGHPRTCYEYDDAQKDWERMGEAFRVVRDL